MRAFAHVLNDPRTQDIPLIMETPAFDVTSGAQRKNQFRPGEGWDIWRTEVAVLNRLAGSRSAQAKAIEKGVGVKAESDSGTSQSADASEEESVKFEKWTQEIRAVVQRVSGAAKKYVLDDSDIKFQDISLNQVDHVFEMVLADSTVASFDIS